jgi:hypothetical protein
MNRRSLLTVIAEGLVSDSWETSPLFDFANQSTLVASAPDLP